MQLTCLECLSLKWEDSDVDDIKGKISDLIKNKDAISKSLSSKLPKLESETNEMWDMVMKHIN